GQVTDQQAEKGHRADQCGRDGNQNGDKKQGEHQDFTIGNAQVDRGITTQGDNIVSTAQSPSDRRYHQNRQCRYGKKLSLYAVEAGKHPVLMPRSTWAL